MKVDAETRSGDSGNRRRRPTTRRARVAAVALVSAFALAIAGAAGTQVYGYLTGLLFPSPSAVVGSSANPSTGPPVSASAPTPETPTPTLSVLLATELRIFAPFTYAGLGSSYRVVGKDVGDCTGSSISGDPEALRCFGTTEFSDGMYIYDPCWMSLDLDQVACIADPWTTEATGFTMKTQDTSGHVPNSLPWALELAVPGTGSEPVRCTFLGGASDSIAGERINYSCSVGARPAGNVIGDVVKSKGKPWLVYYRSPSSADAVQVPVRTAWK